MIWLFWVLAAAMTAAAVALVTLPLWRRSEQGEPTSRRAANIAIYRERVAELRAEAGERLPQAHAQALEDELGRRLLSEADAGEEDDGTVAAPRPGRPWKTTVAVVLAVPVLAFAVYWAGGEWRLAGGEPGLGYLAARMTEAVAAQPNNVQAWMLLGQAREAQGRYADAAVAYGRVNALLPEPHAALLIREAEALLLASGGNLAGRPAALFERALVVEPSNGIALWYAGLAAARAGAAGQARAYWQKLLQQDLPPDFRSVVEESLAALDAPANEPVPPAG